MPCCNCGSKVATVLIILFLLTGAQECCSLAVASRKPTFADLQKCTTPQQMLDQVGAKLPIETSDDSFILLSSTLLVRLSKLMVMSDNQRKYSSKAKDDTNEDWKHHDSSCWGRVVKAFVSNGSWSSSPATIEAAVEGTKAAAVLARLSPGINQEIFDPILQQWATNRISPQRLTPSQISGLKWATDTFHLLHFEKASMPPDLEDAYKNLQLPFRIRPGAVASISDLTVPKLLEQVDFQQDTIKTTSTKKIVPERRETAWEGDESVAPFQYSGKNMPRKPWSPVVRAVRDALKEQVGVYYDGCLLNRYPDGGSGMRYHIDPDQGTLWDYSTTVVSVGATRKFAFREIEGTSKPHVFTLMQGDCTEMFADCQLRFQHTVRTAEMPQDDGARASLVFKKSL